MIGKLLNDTYVIERVIGQGAMGVVYEVRHQRLGRRFALKLLLGSLADRADSRERFRREARIASQLVHPNIVEVVDYNISEAGLPYLVMELLTGELLSERLQRVGQLPLAQTARVLRELCGALGVAHRSGIVHRDLKPGNIVLCQHGDRDDYVKVLDFGISKVVGALQQLTKARAMIGTPRYMAPEQAAGDTAKTDRRADVYALGAIIYEILGGAPVISGADLNDLIYRVVNEDPVPLTEREPSVPAAVAEVIHRALAKRPAERFDSMTELWEAFYGAATATGEISLELLSLESSRPGGDAPGLRTLDLGAPPEERAAHLGAGLSATMPLGDEPASAGPPAAARMSSGEALAETARTLGATPAQLLADGSTALLAEPGRPPMGRTSHLTQDGEPETVLDPETLIEPAGASQRLTAHHHPPSAEALESWERGPRRSPRAVIALATAAGVLLLLTAVVIVLLLGRPPAVTPTADAARVGLAAARDGGSPTAAALTDTASAGDAAAEVPAPVPVDAARARPDGSARAATRQLTVVSHPSGARVLVDGQLVGHTPLEGWAASPRRFTLALHRRGYRAWSKTLSAGRMPLQVRARLTARPRPRRASAILQVMTLADGRPLWANAYLDGKAVGQTPLRITVAAGTHTLVVRRAGYGERRRRLRLRAGRSAVVRINLR